MFSVVVLWTFLCIFYVSSMSTKLAPWLTGSIWEERFDGLCIGYILTSRSWSGEWLLESEALQQFYVPQFKELWRFTITYWLVTARRTSFSSMGPIHFDLPSKVHVLVMIANAESSQKAHSLLLMAFWNFAERTWKAVLERCYWGGDLEAGCLCSGLYTSSSHFVTSLGWTCWRARYWIGIPSYLRQVYVHSPHCSTWVVLFISTQV